MNITQGKDAEEWLRTHGVIRIATSDSPQVIRTDYRGEIDRGEEKPSRFDSWVRPDSLSVWDGKFAHGLDTDTGILVCWFSQRDTCMIYGVHNSECDNTQMSWEEVVGHVKKMGQHLGVYDA